MSKSNIQKGLNEHLNESYKYFEQNQIVGIFLQGSQNYNLNLPNSDIDTKLIITPSFKSLALNKKPISTTHIKENQEHIDWKDVRLYVETFRKQNLNFLEILFTDYFWINPLYAQEWNKLIEKREEIAHMNPVKAVKSMYGCALTEYKNIERFSPTHAETFKQHNYNPKAISNLVRMKNYLERYIAGESYKECMIPKGQTLKLILDLKLGKYSLEEVREIADENMRQMDIITQNFISNNVENENENVKELLDDVLYNIMKISIEKEILNDN